MKGVVSQMSVHEVYDVVSNMKQMVEKEPDKAKQMFVSHPQVLTREAWCGPARFASTRFVFPDETWVMHILMQRSLRRCLLEQPAYVKKFASHYCYKPRVCLLGFSYTITCAAMLISYGRSPRLCFICKFD